MRIVERLHCITEQATVKCNLYIIYLLNCSFDQRVFYQFFVFHFCTIISRCANSVKHFQIGWDGKQYTFGMGKFDNLSEFVEHFENKPLIGGDSGLFSVIIIIYNIRGQVPGIPQHREWDY